MGKFSVFGRAMVAHVTKLRHTMYFILITDCFEQSVFIPPARTESVGRVFGFLHRGCENLGFVFQDMG